MKEIQNNENEAREIFKASHLFLLVSYTLFSIVLICETILLSWELWVIPLIIISIVFCWFLHISGNMAEKYRLWVFTIIILFTFFFYGIHATSFYDLACVISYFIILFSMTGDTGFVTLGQIVYYLTMIYNIFIFIRNGKVFDTLEITRIILHFMVIFLIGYVSKLTIRKRMSIYKKLDEDVKRSKGVSRRMDDFLKSVSHEIRTPINAVIGLTTVMLKKEKDEAIKKDMGSVLSAGYRAADQIGNILDYTEIDTGSLAVENSVYMISSIINDLITELKLQNGISKELIFNVDPNMPSALIGDGVKIKKILRELIVNGIKYTKRGGVYVCIKTMERPYGVNLTMEISDTGVGMREEEIDRLFEKYYGLETVKVKNAGGFGIGMRIVNGLAKALGGFVKIESIIDTGTTVKVTIPQRIADPSACMTLPDKSGLCIALYLHYEKTIVPRMRDYYNMMISDFEKGLGIVMHRAENIEGLRSLSEKLPLTHIITGKAEYLENSAIMEAMALGTSVIVLTDDDFEEMPGTSVKIIRKPCSGFPFAAALSSTPKRQGTVERSALSGLRGLETLVVDDEKMNLIVARGIFKEYGMHVTEALSGPQAIELCKKKHFDLIFMDHMMPDMDGIEAMRLLRRNAGKKDEELIIIALTANAVSGAKEMFLSEGFDGFIPKPIEILEFERVVLKALKRYPRLSEKTDEQGMLREGEVR